jgi:hypothetical protein
MPTPHEKRTSTGAVLRFLSTQVKPFDWPETLVSITYPTFVHAIVLASKCRPFLRGDLPQQLLVGASEKEKSGSGDNCRKEARACRLSCSI